jgi:hypothetical protein
MKLTGEETGLGAAARDESAGTTTALRLATLLIRPSSFGVHHPGRVTTNRVAVV